MKVIVEMSLFNCNGLGMGSLDHYAVINLSIEEWSKGNTQFSEEYLIVKDNETQEHLFKVRMGSKKQVYLEMNNGDIITIRGEQ